MRAYELTEAVKTKLDTPEFKALLTPGLLRLGKIYRDHGRDIRIVGGAVRDLVLGKEPKDVDLATDATPEESIKYLEQAGVRVVPTGLQHGTVTAVIDGEDFEITTLRIDVETFGRKANVAFTRDWKKDAERRDLTFNAMSLELDGTLYDYFGGIEDLKKQKAQFVGSADQRIKEDYLRTLRYFRFKGRLSQPEFDQNTLDAIERNAKGLEQISGERIWMEMAKILSGNNTQLLLDKIRDTGVDLYINLPPLNTESLNRIKAHTDNAATILGGMLQKEAQVNKLADDWKFSVPERELMKFIVKHKYEKFDLKIAKEMWTSKKSPNDFVLELARYFGRDDIVRDLQAWQTPVFPVSGNDLMTMGIKAGPEMGKLLRDLERKWKDSNYELSKEELLRTINATQ